MKHYYLVVFPQGIRQDWNDGDMTGTTYTKSMKARSQQEAYNLLEKYNGGYIEKIQVGRRHGRYGRWCTATWIPEKFQGKTETEIWDILEKEPEIVLEPEIDYSKCEEEK